jgi:hypothetical protein
MTRDPLNVASPSWSQSDHNLGVLTPEPIETLALLPPSDIFDEPLPIFHGPAAGGTIEDIAPSDGPERAQGIEVAVDPVTGLGESLDTINSSFPATTDQLTGSPVGQERVMFPDTFSPEDWHSLKIVFEEPGVYPFPRQGFWGLGGYSDNPVTNAYYEFLLQNPRWREENGEGGFQLQVIASSSRLPWIQFSTPGAAQAFDTWYEHIYEPQESAPQPEPTPVSPLIPEAGATNPEPPSSLPADPFETEVPPLEDSTRPVLDSPALPAPVKISPDTDPLVIPAEAPPEGDAPEAAPSPLLVFPPSDGGVLASQDSERLLEELGLTLPLS